MTRGLEQTSAEAQDGHETRACVRVSVDAPGDRGEHSQMQGHHAKLGLEKSDIADPYIHV